MIGSMGAEDRLAELGIDLPPANPPLASYVPVVVTGSLAFVSGQVAIDAGTPMWTGHLGADVSLEDGQAAARRCAIQALAALKAELGSLDRIRRIVKLTVWVASAPGFTDQPKVANGASDFLQEVFGEAGRHARAAVAAPDLPLGVPVELELIAEVG
jgi:enamine deaminase RidA (YjgF/YER057c/UK114 family)